MCGWCGDGWRFELTYLGGPNAGQVKGVLHPIAAQFEELYSRPSGGSITLATRDVSADDVWPDTGIYISQVMPDGTRRGRFGGYFPKNNGSGGGALTVAIESLDGYLNHRLLAGNATPFGIFFQPGGVSGNTVVDVGVSIPIDGPPINGEVGIKFYSYPGITRSALPVTLVKVAQGAFDDIGDPQAPTGIPTLDANVMEPSEQFPNTPPYPPFVEGVAQWWDFKNIGQFIDEIVSAEDGPKYQLEHTYSNGYWTTEMNFADDVGIARDYTLRSDREGWQYGLEVDGTDKTSRMYGIGPGEEWTTQYSIAYDAGRDRNYPERQGTQAWKDSSNAANLDGLTKGWVASHRDPTTVPSMTLVGLPDYDSDAEGYDPQKGFPAPEICRPGDSYGVDIGYGAVTVKGIRVRNLGIAWNLQEGSPVERVLAMQPVERPALSIKTQTPAKPAANEVPLPSSSPPDGSTGSPTADPWPTPGVMSTINAGLTEISGIEVSRTNPGYMWALDDERATPQVVLVHMRNGLAKGSFTPNPGVSGGNVGDPEAIRLARSTGKLVIADTGDNDLNRPTSGANQPHLIALPEPKGVGAKGTLAAVRYPIAYPGGARVNVETLLIHPTTEEVLLISKEATRARVFSYGPLSSMSTVNNVGTLVKTLPNMKLVSDATHSFNGNFILFRLAGNTNTIVLKSNWGYAGAIATPAMAKSEAIAVVNSCAFVTTTEGVRPPLYQVLIPKSYGATCATPAGPSGGGSTPSNPSIKVPGQLISMNNWKLQLPI